MKKAFRIWGVALVAGLLFFAPQMVVREAPKPPAPESPQAVQPEVFRDLLEESRLAEAVERQSREIRNLSADIDEERYEQELELDRRRPRQYQLPSVKVPTYVPYRYDARTGRWSGGYWRSQEDGR